MKASQQHSHLFMKSVLKAVENQTKLFLHDQEMQRPSTASEILFTNLLCGT